MREGQSSSCIGRREKGGEQQEARLTRMSARQSERWMQLQKDLLNQQRPELQHQRERVYSMCFRDSGREVRRMSQAGCSDCRAETGDVTEEAHQSKQRTFYRNEEQREARFQGMCTSQIQKLAAETVQ